MQSLWRSVLFVWQRAKIWFLALLLVHLLSGLLPIGTLWLTMELVNSVTSLIQGQSDALSVTLWLVGLQFLFSVCGSALRSLEEILSERIKLTVEHEMQREITGKASSVPLAYFDIPDFYNHYQRIQGGLGERFLSPVRNVLESGQALIRLVGFLAFLWIVHWGLALISIAAALPLMIVQSKFGEKRFWLLYRQTPAAREAGYIAALLTDRQSIKEVRLFGLSPYLLSRWSQKYLQNAFGYFNLMVRQKATNTGLDALTGLVYAAASVVLVFAARGGTMKVGDFVATGQALFGAQMAVNQIAMSVARVYEESLFLRDLFAFLQYEVPELKRAQTESVPFPKPLAEGIVVDNLSFSYVQSDREVLRDVSFQIRKGERIAIVGENGSGKTTLVKCLMGFYQPTKGAILYDGVPTEDFSERELQRQITVIFQDFMQYAFTVRENIAFGDLDGIQDEDRLQRVARESQVEEFVQKFPAGYDTYLGRYLAEGEDLSGGQWQKIALARALFRDGQILILDEPTAALDPQAEMEVFEQFDRLSQGKTTLFISHRMAAARIADRILVMKQGRLVESGTHRELMAQEGEYSRMYRMQAQWYAEERMQPV